MTLSFSSPPDSGDSWQADFISLRRVSRRGFFGFVPEGTAQRSQRNLLGGVEAG